MKEVNWMGAVMRSSFFGLLAVLLLSWCSPEVLDAADTSRDATEKSAVISAAAAGTTAIYRDSYGTPHVVADSNYGVYFGYGYAVATDRLFQMEMLRRTVEGRVAEVLGSEYLDLDKYVRTGYDHRAVSRQLKRLDDQDREILDAYAAGFSKRVSEVLSEQATDLPREFIDYEFLPQKWSSYDVAMIFIGSIIHRYSDFNSELDNLSLLSSLTELHGTKKAKKIFDASKWLTDVNSPTTVPRAKQLGAPMVPILGLSSSIEQPLDNVQTTRVLLGDSGQFMGTTNHPEMQRVADEQLAKYGYIGPEFQAASNFWSVNSHRLSDADGALVNGPQFGFGLPSYVYGIGLHGGDFDLVGNTLLGLPSMLFAHNNHVSWGSTAGMSDQVDVYRERLVVGKPEHYRHNGQDKKFETWEETIKVKGQADVAVTARRSVHGMVVSMNSEKATAYTRARAWEGAEVATLVAWINLAKDKTLDAVQSRLSNVAANINFYYMDVDGNLGYTHGGRYPLRAQSHDSRIPAEGSGRDDWLGFRPYSDSPNVRNPDQGYIVNWNNRPAAGWLASDLWTYTWSEADRSKHIVNEITSSEKITTDDIWAITERVSYDDVSATFIIPYLVEAMSSVADGSKVKLALDIVENWDHEWRVEANGEYGSAELIVENWTKRLFENVFKDDIGDEKYAMYAATNNPNNRLGPSMGSSVGSKVILRNMTSLLSNTNVYDFFNGEEPGKILSRSFTEAIDTLVIKHGSDLTQWALPAAPMTWKPYNFRGVPQASEGSLVSLPAYMNRGSENNFFVAKAGRFVAFDVNPPGQSGFVAPDGTASAHSQDQMTLYSTYGTKALPFTLEEIKAAAVEIETLNDESAAYGVKVGAGL